MAFKALRPEEISEAAGVNRVRCLSSEQISISQIMC